VSIYIFFNKTYINMKMDHNMKYSIIIDDSLKLSFLY